jgi:hypothetical protein
MKEAQTANTRLASCGVTFLHSSSAFQLGFSGVLTVLFFEIQHERQAQKHPKTKKKNPLTNNQKNTNHG